MEVLIVEGGAAAVGVGFVRMLGIVARLRAAILVSKWRCSTAVAAAAAAATAMSNDIDDPMLSRCSSAH